MTQSCAAGDCDGPSDAATRALLERTLYPRRYCAGVGRIGASKCSGPRLMRVMAAGAFAKWDAATATSDRQKIESRPSRQMTAVYREQEIGMYRNILIATDGAELGQKAVGQGLSLARALGAAATVITVTEPYRVSGELDFAISAADYETAAKSSAQAILAHAVDIARKVAITCNTVHVADRFPAEGIVETADKLGCDLIVMASHGRRGVSRVLLGSEASKVVVMSKVPVLVCR